MARLIALGLGHLLADMLLNVLPAALPWLIPRLGLTLAMAGSAVAAMKVTSGFAQPLVGYLMDRRGRPWLFAPSLLWTGLLTGAIAAVDDYAALVVLVAAAGLGSAVVHPLGMVMVRHTLPGRSGLAMSIWSAGGTLGLVLAPLPTVATLEGFGIPGLWLFAVPAALVALGASAVGVQRLPVTLALPQDGPPPAAAQARRPRGLVPANGRPVLWLTAALLVRSMLQMSLSTFLTVYYVRQHGYTPEAAAWMLLLYTLAGTAGSLLGGWWADRRGRREVTLLTQILAPAFAVAFLLTSGWPAAILLALTAAAIFSTFSVGAVYGQELLPEQPGTASGLIAGFAWGTAALLLGPVGAVADRVGLPLALSGVAVLCVVSALFIVPLPETRPQTPRLVAPSVPRSVS